MNTNDRRIGHLFNQLAERLVPDDADLRPIVRDRLALRGHPTVPAGARQRRLPSLAAVALLALVLTIGVPATVFAASGAVRDRLQHFGLVLIEPTAAPARPASRAGVPAVASAAIPPVSAQTWLSLDDAQRQIPFPIRVPTWLPAGLTLRGALVGHGGAVNGGSGVTTVILSYGTTDGATHGLHLDQRPGASAGGIAVPAGQEQPAVVNGQAATYVRGAWRPDGSWDATADSGILSWATGGSTYVVQFSGLGLSREALIRIAESVR